MELNPGVERAVAAMSATPIPTAAAWLRVLLADDEGRSAMILSKMGLESSTILQQLPDSGVAFPIGDVLHKAREHSVRLQADPEFTTDLLMVALLFEDPILAEALGIRLEVLEAVVRSPLVEAAAPRSMPGATFDLPDLTEHSDAARAVDANINRAREALRVLDDYARFTRNDALLTGLAKSLRHRLAELSTQLPLQTYLAARDTPGDVGTSLSGPGEYNRSSLLHVAAVNCKRLQESLRSIEEFGKLLKPAIARAAESMRYEAYTLERTLLGASPLRDRIASARLYVLLGGASCSASLEWTLAEGAVGGAEVFQLREKNLSDRELLNRAKQMREWTRANRTLFIVNDRADIARLSDADGVHLGQDDLSVSEARRILGPLPLIGVSTHTIDQVRTAVRDGADYLGIGPTFLSSTKQFESLAGLEFIRTASTETSLPMFALGGITAANIVEVIEAGATRVAVSSAIAQADEPRLAALQLKNSLTDISSIRRL